MKAEEEDVDIITITVATSPPTQGFAGPTVTRSGSVVSDSHRMMSSTPAPPSSTATLVNGDAVAAATNPDGGDGGDAMAVDTSVDPDTLWAEEDPDDDVPGGWRMKILMEEDDDE